MSHGEIAPHTLPRPQPQNIIITSNKNKHNILLPYYIIEKLICTRTLYIKYDMVK